MRKLALALILSTVAMLVVPALARACPVINGTFIMPYKEKDGTAMDVVMTKFTRQDRGAFSYTIDKAGNFQAADGVKRPIRVGDREGTARLECQGGTLLEETQATGSDKVWYKKITPLSATKLRVESNLSNRTGIYTKQR